MCLTVFHMCIHKLIPTMAIMEKNVSFNLFYFLPLRIFFSLSRSDLKRNISGNSGLIRVPIKIIISKIKKNLLHKTHICFLTKYSFSKY